MQKKLLNKKDGKNFFSFLWQDDILIAISIIAIIGILIIPIPTFLLDILIVLNIALSLSVLLIAIYIAKPFEFSSFPTLILIMTLFRLGINISSTRLILLNGEAFDANIILAFGDFVVQNNYIVGAIIFLILIAVQFIVIIKGATRVSEVAARFTLDGMPGKQMSVDSDLSSGLITEQEALRRRKEIREEVDFYGAMDGASKFVQGDVRVGLFITLINILGGMAVGTILQGLSLFESFDIFFILTVGDGLSAQIPSLLLSTATGIIVTRSVSDQSLGKDIHKQVSLSPKAIILTGTFLLFLAFLPGFPMLILIIIGSIILTYGLFINGSFEDLGFASQASLDDLEKENNKKKSEETHMHQEWMQLDVIEIELGYQLIPFVDTNEGGNILDRIRMIRRSLAIDMGLLVPPIRVRDNLRLNPEEYLVKIRGIEVDKGILNVKKLLAIPSPQVSEKILGDETVEPAFKTKAFWIYPELKDEAERKFYSVVDPVSILTTHMTELIKKYSSDILGRQEVKDLLDSLKEKYPNLVEDTLKVASLGKIQKILHLLLREKVSIRNLPSILEVISDYSDKTSNIENIYNMVREKLGRQIIHQYRSTDEILRVYTFSSDLEKLIEDSIQETETGYISVLNIEKSNEIVLKCINKYTEASKLGYVFVLLVSRSIRFFMRNLLIDRLSYLAILSYNELPSDVQLDRLGIIELKDEKKEEASNI